MAPSAFLFRIAGVFVFACVTTLPISAQTAADQAVPPPPPQRNMPARAPLNPALPTIFVVGDSTASNGPDRGWGSHLANYFDLTKVNVANRAIAGRSSRSYMDEGHWDSTLAEIKPGDYVLLQWGQNDGGDMGGAGSRNARGDLRGDGDETQDLMQTIGPKKGEVETIHTYGWYNRKYVADILAKHATPMFLSMTIHNTWKPDASGTERVALDMRFGPVMWKIAKEHHLKFIDMAAVEETRLDNLGQEKTKPLFPIDWVHSSPEGAELIAKDVVIALEIAKSPLVKYLKEKIPIPAGDTAATKKSEKELAAIAASNGPPAFVAPERPASSEKNSAGAQKP